MRLHAVIVMSMALVACEEVPDSATVKDTAAAETKAEPDPIDKLTGPQKNARRSAETYLEMKGFSRNGLIQQLSSDAGDGYEKADATAAVDSIDVNWNEQAARSAKDYLNMMGFSCDGLVDQLSSSAGDGFTKEEASYGAKQAGACG